MPSTIKKIKGKSYLYYSYYDPQEQKKKEVYCGQSDTIEAKRKVLELEIEYLKNQSKNYAERAEVVKKQLLKTQSKHS